MKHVAYLTLAVALCLPVRAVGATIRGTGPEVTAESDADAEEANVEARADLAPLSPAEIVERYERSSVPRAKVETQSGAVIAEAAQILGQIVATRASNHAFSLLRDKMVQELKCSDERDGTRFAETCTVLAALRVQELATAPRALYRALVLDAFQMILDAAKLDDGDMVRHILAKSVLPLLLKENPSEIDAAGVVAELNAIAIEKVKSWAKLGASEQAALAGILANMQCVTAYRAAPQFTPQDCPVEQLASHVIEKAGTVVTPEMTVLAHRLARLVLAAYTLKAPPGTAGAGRERLASAVAAMGEVACVLGAGSANKAGCASLTVVSTVDATTPELVRWKYLSAATHLAGAVVGRDSNQVVAITVLMVEDAYDTLGIRTADRRLQVASTKRGLRLVAALVQYGATFSGDKSDPAKLHEQRTEILESLTLEMTDRSGRGGDWILALGGALRVAGGRRYDAHDPEKRFATLGPVSLPLGVGLDWTGGDTDWGLHFDANVLDLGGYVSFKEGTQVAEPELQDALSVSLTAAVAHGRQFPMFLGVSGGFSPSIHVGASKQATWFWGIVGGVYVPLFDVN